MPQSAGLYQPGKTREEAITNIRDAIEGCVAALKEDGLPIPVERFETLVLAR